MTSVDGGAAMRAAKMARYQARVADYAWLRDQGVPVAEAAARLGVSARTAERYEQVIRGGESGT